MSPHLYVLDAAGEPRPESNVVAWGRWFERSRREPLKVTELSETVRVSTIFLGINHNFTENGPPILWETMVFGLPQEEQFRYATRAAALAHHDELVAQLRTGHGLQLDTIPDAPDLGGPPPVIFRVRRRINLDG